MSDIVLLGPQSDPSTLAATLDRLAIDGPVAIITAGWQEREGELDPWQMTLSQPLHELALYQQTETVFAADPDLLTAHRQRQDRLQELQRLYRLRLAYLLQTARELFATDGRDDDLLDQARQSALTAIRLLDRQHLRSIVRIHTDFETDWQPQQRPALAEARQQIAERLADCQALVIAGGHVAVLLSRMRLFGFGTLLDTSRPLIAWSAGAMVLTDKIVLFHDHPPQGPGDPEILDTGFGLLKQMLPLPHARQRLRLDDPARVGLFAGRFARDRCITLDDGAALVIRDGHLVDVTASYLLQRTGQLGEPEKAA